MKLDGKQTLKDKMAVAESRVGKNSGVSKGKAKLPKAKIKARPTGGLKPKGFKASITWKM